VYFLKLVRVRNNGVQISVFFSRFVPNINSCIRRCVSMYVNVTVLDYLCVFSFYIILVFTLTWFYRWKFAYFICKLFVRLALSFLHVFPAYRSVSIFLIFVLTVMCNFIRITGFLLLRIPRWKKKLRERTITIVEKWIINIFKSLSN